MRLGVPRPLYAHMGADESRPAKRARVDAPAAPVSGIECMLDDMWWVVLSFLVPIDIRAVLYTCRRMQAPGMRRRAGRMIRQRVLVLLADLGVPNALVPRGPSGVASAAAAGVLYGTPPPFGPDATLSGSFMWFALVEPRRLRLPVDLDSLALLRVAGLYKRPRNHFDFYNQYSTLTVAETRRVHALGWEIIPEDRRAHGAAAMVRRALDRFAGVWRPGDLDVFCTPDGATRMTAWLEAHVYTLRYSADYEVRGDQLTMHLFSPPPCGVSTMNVQLIIRHDASAGLLPRFDLPALENGYDGQCVDVRHPEYVCLKGSPCEHGTLRHSRPTKYAERGMVIGDLPAPLWPDDE